MATLDVHVEEALDGQPENSHEAVNLTISEKTNIKKKMTEKL